MVDGRNRHASDGRLLAATLFDITTSPLPRFTPWRRNYCKTMVGISTVFFEGCSLIDRRFANSSNKADGTPVVRQWLIALLTTISHCI
jgi:hypothetical protein